MFPVVCDVLCLNSSRTEVCVNRADVSQQLNVTSQQSMSPTVLQECDCFLKAAAYITHSATQPLSDITGSLIPLLLLPNTCNTR